MAAQRLAAPASSTGTGDQRRPVVVDDLFALRFLMGADMTPDGGHVVYALSRTDLDANTDHSDLFLLEVESGVTRRLTHVDAVHAAPAFSPDGRHIAFLSSGDGMPQIFVLPIDGGPARQLTSLPRGVGGGPAWSPDGTRVAFTAGPQGEPRDPTMPYRVSRAVWRADGIGLIDDAVQDIYVVASTGGHARRLTDDAAMNYDPVWAHDGRSINYLASHDPDAAPMAMHLRRVTLDGTVTEFAASGFISSHTACRDGRIVYVLGYEFGTLPGTKGDLWVVDPETGHHERRAAGLDVGVGGLLQPDMPAVAMSVGRVVVTDDDARAYAPVQRGGEVAIYRFALSGPEAFEPAAEGERQWAPVCLRGNTLLFTGFGLHEPGDLYVLDTATGDERRVTWLNAERLDELELPPVQRLSFPGADGVMVEGWFLPPVHGGAPYPTVVAIHGGPHHGWGHTFNFEFLLFSGAGFGVLFVNHRGSTGYGDGFATAISFDHGNLDFADVLAGVDHTIELALADPDRLGVFGMSGGGFLTGWAIAHSDRFKAACPQNPGFNWFSSYGTSDTGLWGGPAMLGGKPHEVPERYQRCSPVYAAHQCTTPTLFIQHEEDHRTPPEQTEQFYAILKASGVEAEMLRLPGTGHLGSLVGPPSHRRAVKDAMLEWMRRFLVREG